MAFSIQSGNIIQFTFRGTIWSQVCLTTFHYQYVGISTIADGASAVGDMADAMQLTSGLYSRYRAVMPTAWVNGQIWAQKIYTSRFRKEVITPTNTTGVNTDVPASTADAIAITLHADVAARNGICTKHLPGVVPSSLSESELTVGAKTAYDLVALAAIATINIGTGLDFEPVIYHRANPNQSLFITGGTTQTEARTMRRRVVRRGI